MTTQTALALTVEPIIRDAMPCLRVKHGDFLLGYAVSIVAAQRMVANAGCDWADVVIKGSGA